MANSRHAFFASTVSVVAVFSAVPALAQSNDTAAQPVEQGDVGEIIVTAQKRAQNLNDVGLSITAASSDQLAAAGI
ncbi:MAG: hypothetical protein QHC67_19105, partial [Sphingobium sp.]|uniref:hypothetical protein n=1 Tax=Sphingobium sp. TaxID=1912891 RepID=UPI0029AD860C